MSRPHCAQASATVLSQDQFNLSLEGATWSFLKYHSKLGLYCYREVKIIVFERLKRRNPDGTVCPTSYDDVTPLSN